MARRILEVEGTTVMIHFGNRIVIDGSHIIGFVNGQQTSAPNRDHAAFESGVRAILRRIDNCVVGHGLLAAIERMVHIVTIVPCATISEVGARAIDHHASPAGSIVRDFLGQPLQSNGPPVLGLGGGSNVIIRFHLSAPGLNSAAFLLRANDSVLVHELVHALRSVSGHLNNLPLPGTQFSSREEFLSIIVENMYVTIRGNYQVRISHRPIQFVYDPPPSPYGPPRVHYTSEAWAKRFGTILDDIWNEERFLCWEMITAGGHFNPVRDRRALVAALRFGSRSGTAVSPRFTAPALPSPHTAWSNTP